MTECCIISDSRWNRTWCCICISGSNRSSVSSSGGGGDGTISCSCICTSANIISIDICIRVRKSSISSIIGCGDGSDNNGKFGRSRPDSCDEKNQMKRKTTQNRNLRLGRK